jgi:hypothetical protein
MEKKKHPGKGDYGYYAYEKKKRIGIVCLLFGICLGIYITGLIMTHTNKNMFSLVAILGVLPAAKWATEMIMILLQKDIDPEVYEITEKIAGALTHGYELCITAYEGRLALDAVVICGNFVVCYSSAEKGRFEFMETHMRTIFHGNGLGNPTVKIFRRLDQYKERISQLAADPEKYREGLKYTPDEQHEGESREEALLRLIRNISL